MRNWLGLLALLAVLSAGQTAAAAPPALAWPVDCALGQDCWLVHHVDTEPGPAVRDFRCGALTYNDHKGTDIAVRDRVAMFRPFTVRAAAAGVVAGVRDTAPDHPGDDASIKAAMEKGEECGNGVLVQHADGWSTQYCHLKSGSVPVAKGQPVEAGDLIGYVGNSGAAAFPHLHLAVRRGREVVDPFTGLAMGQGCEAEPAASLWSEPVQAFLPVRDEPFLFGAGFRASAPRYDALLQDMRSPATLEADGAGLVLWGVAVGLREGDVMTLTIADPAGGTFIAREFMQEKTQIRRMRFAGRSNRNGILLPGTYQGIVQVKRGAADGQPLLVVEKRVSVDLVE